MSSSIDPASRTRSIRHAGAAAMDYAFGTEDDGSTDGRWFSTSEDLPFALATSGDRRVSVRVKVSNLFGHRPLRDSGGHSNQNFYETNVRLSRCDEVHYRQFRRCRAGMARRDRYAIVASSPRHPWTKVRSWTTSGFFTVRPIPVPPHTATVDFGDGTPWRGSINADQAQASHTYLDAHRLPID